MPTSQIAAFASQTRFDALPKAVVMRAKICLYDWLVVASLGSREPYSPAIEKSLLDGSGTDGIATIIGRSRKTSPFNAAMINGVNSHCLDFDDMHVAMNGHPGVVVYSAALAAAESEGASGNSLITAFALGAETACRFGAALSPSHYARGWHATSTAGVLGAAVAAGTILSLTESQFGHALGLAATQSSGLQRVFGTAGKPLNAGHAAACGLLSARLAKEGMTAPPDVFSGDQGYFQLYADTVDNKIITGDLGKTYYMEDIVIKRLSSCFSTHAPILAAIELHRQHEREMKLVQKIAVHVSQMAINVAGIPKATNIPEAKFSIAYCVASALAKGQLLIPEGITDKEIQRLSDRVVLEVDNSIKHDERKATVVIEMSDGQKYREAADLLSEAHSAADDWNSITEKAVNGRLAAEGLRIDDLRNDIESLERMPNIRTLIEEYFWDQLPFRSDAEVDAAEVSSALGQA